MGKELLCKLKVSDDICALRHIQEEEKEKEKKRKRYVVLLMRCAVAKGIKSGAPNSNVSTLHLKSEALPSFDQLLLWTLSSCRFCDRKRLMMIWR